MNELEVRSPFDALWEKVDPFEWLRSVPGETFRRVGGRRTFRFEHDGHGYFAKTHSGTQWREVVKNWLSLRPPIYDAHAEVRAIRRLERAGVAVPEIVAWGRRGKRRTTRQSFLVTRDVGTQRTLEDIAREGVAEAWRKLIVRDLAVLARTMHAAGVNHRDCYLTHVLVRSLAREGADLVLLDLHRAQVRDVVPSRWRAKDLAGLWFSSAPAKPRRTELLRFVRDYVGTSPSEELRTNRSFWSAVERRRGALLREIPESAIPR